MAGVVGLPVGMMLLNTGSVVYGGANGSHYPTTADHIRYLLPTGVVDSKVITHSFWMKFDSATGDALAQLTTARVQGSSIRFSIYTDASKRIEVLGVNSTGTTVLLMRGNTPISNNNWNHVFISFDLSDPAKRLIAINGAAETLTVTTYTNTAIDFSPTNNNPSWMRNATHNGMVGTISEVWVSQDTYFGIGDIGKFYSGVNLPTYLGTNGEIPTGISPIYYFADGRTNTGSSADVWTISGTVNAVSGPNP